MTPNAWLGVGLTIELNGATGSGGLTVPGIRCSRGLDQEDVRLLLGNRAVLYALRHNEQFARA